MADLQRTVEIIFGAVDSTASAIRSVEARLDGITTKATDVAGKITEITAAAAGIAVAFGTYAVAMNDEWTVAVGAINNLTNGSVSDMQRLSDDLITYARGSTSTLSDITDAAYIAISTGTKPEDIAEILGLAETLADASASSLTTAVGVVTRTQNAFGVELEGLEGLVDDLFATVQNGDTNLTELSNYLGAVAPIAAAAQVPFELVGAAIASITAAGVGLPDTVTKLTGLFGELSTPSDELKEALGGIIFNGENLPEVLKQIDSATGGDFASVTKLFGQITAAEAALLLIGNAADGFKETSEKMATNTGAVATAAALTAEDVSKSFQNLKNNALAAVIDLGDELAPTANSILNGLSGIFGGLGTAISEDAELNGLLSDLADFARDFEADLDKIATILPEAFKGVDFQGIKDALNDLYLDLAGAFSKVFGENIDLTNVDDLTRVLQGAVNILSTFVSTTSGIINSLDPVFDALGVIAQEVGGIDNDTAQVVGDILGKLALIGEAGLALGGFLIALDETDTQMFTVLSNIKDASVVLINILQVAFGKLFAEFSTAVSDINKGLSYITWGDLSDRFELQSDRAGRAAEAFTLGAQSDVEELKTAWDSLTGRVNNNATETDTAAKRLERRIGDFSKAAREDLSSVPDAVSSGISESETEINTLLSDAQTKSNERLKLAQLEADTTQLAIVNNADVTKEAIESAAKINLKEIEAEATKVEAVLDNIGKTIDSSASVISTFIDRLSGVESLHEEAVLYRLIEQEYKLREDAINLNNRLVSAEADLVEEKLRRLRDGGGLINIQADGLEPELEAFMWRIVEKLQVRVAEDRAEFLLGWGG